MDFENGTIPLDKQAIGSRVVDLSWTWELHTGRGANDKQVLQEWKERQVKALGYFPDYVFISMSKNAKGKQLQPRGQREALCLFPVKFFHTVKRVPGAQNVVYQGYQMGARVQKALFGVPG